MTGASSHGRFTARPGDPDRWIRSAEASPRASAAAGYTARLTIDVTPELRGRIKVAAFERGITVADMLRDLFAREFPADERGSK
ncbi:ribbon-helix-helix protein [Mesorhizobium australicum]|uniref:Plasmid segregation centromere-binding protein ParG n=1 Tax=Mesorhizobium australicum TaxID=536018 RepID=A0A1X7N068_9HYPH|nr:hypothetical protein [Mesorhizobium australicum]SMH29730.1 hypothetical protein SAMN02982922_0935 [Mesorhizobium australicum]